MFSNPIDLESFGFIFTESAPITLDIVSSRPAVQENEPPAMKKTEFPHVVLTVYYIDGEPTKFRIAATNLAGGQITELVVRWWAFQV